MSQRCPYCGSTSREFDPYDDSFDCSTSDWCVACRPAVHRDAHAAYEAAYERAWDHERESLRRNGYDEDGLEAQWARDRCREKASQVEERVLSSNRRHSSFQYECHICHYPSDNDSSTCNSCAEKEREESARSSQALQRDLDDIADRYS